MHSSSHSHFSLLFDLATTNPTKQITPIIMNGNVQQPVVNVENMVAVENGTPIYNKRVREEGTLYNIISFGSKERYDKIFTNILIEDVDSFNKIRKVAYGAETHTHSPPALVELLKQSNLVQWKQLGFGQCIVVVHCVNLPDDNVDNTLAFQVDTKNYSMKRISHWGLYKKDLLSSFKWKVAWGIAGTKLFVDLVEQHELSCRILQNKLRFQAYQTQQDQHNNHLHEELLHLKSNQDAQTMQLTQLSHQIHDGQDYLDTHQQNIKNTLVEHRTILEDLEKRLSKTMNPNQRRAQLQDIQDNITSIEDRLTADAITRDLHQDQLETLFSKIEDVQSSVLLMKANEKVWQETMESDWESRGEWTSRVMHHIGQNDQRTLILQQENNRIKEQLKQYHTDNQWMCVYLCSACVLLYQLFAGLSVI